MTKLAELNDYLFQTCVIDGIHIQTKWLDQFSLWWHIEEELNLGWIKHLQSLERSNKQVLPMALSQTSRTPPPCQLQANETLQSLTHWRTTFKTFYKKDNSYRVFFQPKMQWDPREIITGSKKKMRGSNAKLMHYTFFCIRNLG